MNGCSKKSLANRHCLCYNASCRVKRKWRGVRVVEGAWLEIKCSDELPWVRIPPSLPVKSRLPGVLPWKPFSVLFLFLTSFLTSWHLSAVFLFTLDHLNGKMYNKRKSCYHISNRLRCWMRQLDSLSDGSSCFIRVRFFRGWSLWQQRLENFPAWLYMASEVLLSRKNGTICSTSLRLQK